MEGKLYQAQRWPRSKRMVGQDLPRGPADSRKQEPSFSLMLAERISKFLRQRAVLFSSLDGIGTQQQQECRDASHPARRRAPSLPLPLTLPNKWDAARKRKARCESGDDPLSARLYRSSSALMPPGRDGQCDPGKSQRHAGPLTTRFSGTKRRFRNSKPSQGTSSRIKDAASTPDAKPGIGSVP